MGRTGKVTLVAIGFLMAAAVGLVPFAASAGDTTESDSTSALAGVRSLWRLSSSVAIDGAVGGSLRSTMWTVIVPPGAFQGTATLTLTQPDVRKRLVELSITPESSNRFKVPVKLVYRKATLWENLSQESIYWWNPETMAWEPAPNQSGSLLAGTLTSGLGHFSTYAVFGGKAGW